MALDDFLIYSRKELPGSAFIIQDSPFRDWNYRVLKYPGTFISSRDMVKYDKWCSEHFAEGSFNAVTGQIFTSQSDINGLDSIFFKNREDAVQFLLVWG